MRDAVSGRAAVERPRAAVVRRIILFVILFALVVIAAIGLSGLIERVIGAGSVIVSDDAGLARSLAFALIGGPLAGVLWWWERRRLIADPAERASLVWALYLTAMSLTSLIVATTSLGRAAAAGIDGEWRPGRAVGRDRLVGVWLWHRHMRRSAATAPTRLADLPVGLGAVYGLVVAASGAITAIAVLISQALLGGSAVIVGSQHWIVVGAAGARVVRDGRAGVVVALVPGTGEGRARQVRRGAAGHRGRRRGGDHPVRDRHVPCSSLLRLLFDTDPARGGRLGPRRRHRGRADRRDRLGLSRARARQPFAADPSRRATRRLGDRPHRRRERIRRRSSTRCWRPSPARSSTTTRARCCSAASARSSSGRRHGGSPGDRRARWTPRRPPIPRDASTWSRCSARARSSRSSRS